MSTADIAEGNRAVRACNLFVRNIRNLQEAGIPASADIYHSDMHAFDMLKPEMQESREAIRRFEQAFAYAAGNYFADNC